VTYDAGVGGVKLPPAKFSTIAELVWLLEKSAAPSTSPATCLFRAAGAEWFLVRARAEGVW
jgi:hypothetical protein